MHIPDLKAYQPENDSKLGIHCVDYLPLPYHKGYHLRSFEAG